MGRNSRDNFADDQPGDGATTVETVTEPARTGRSGAGRPTSRIHPGTPSPLTSETMRSRTATERSSTRAGPAVANRWYSCKMESLQDGSTRVYRVSSRGQFSLPAATRHRWGIADGGQIEIFDLGDCAVMLPVGASSARRSLASALTAKRYAEHVRGIEDPDLRDE